MRTPPEMLAAVRRFKRAQLLAAAECVRRLEEIPGGVYVQTPSLRFVRELNLLLAPDTIDEAQAERLSAACERLQAAPGLPYRRLRFSGGADDERIGELLAASGWELDRELIMVRRRSVDAVPGPYVVERVDDSSLIDEAEDALLSGCPYAADREVRRQLAAQRERWRHASQAASSPGVVLRGRLAAWCQLYDDGSSTEIDNVSVRPDERGRGLGRALLEGVIAATPDDRLLFLCTDRDDWTQDLYRRLGFDEIGQRLGATKRLAVD